MDFEKIVRRRGKCCACELSMSRARTPHINLAQLERKANWKHPVAGNVITGEDGYAVAVICDQCAAKGQPVIKLAIECVGGTALVYHKVETLQPWSGGK